MNNAILIKDLSHDFIGNRNTVHAISEFSLTLQENEVVAILGPSGCGKSTILRCIAGFLTPSSGQISINGQNPLTASKEKHIGFAFQDSALLDWASVRENIILPAKVGLRLISNKELVDKEAELLEVMGLTSFAEFYPAQLSGGMKQRVALARALLLKPRLLLLDEPFGSLDLLTRSKLIVELKKILTDTKVPTIIVTHSIEEAVFLADKILILSSRPSKIVAEIHPQLKGQTSFDTFDDTNFICQVAECRKVLLENWKDDEKE